MTHRIGVAARQDQRETHGMSIAIRLTVNDREVSATVEPRLLLVEVLREHLRLTGTHVGCDTSQCGACVVLMDGRSVKAFNDHHALQCGFCTPGMVLSAVDLVNRHPDPTDDQIRAGLDGNLCRCTGYQPIVRAVRAGAHAMRTA
jgi:carbon-monoxide dehydrogenase small subunit